MIHKRKCHLRIWNTLSVKLLSRSLKKRQHLFFKKETLSFFEKGHYPISEKRHYHFLKGDIISRITQNSQYILFIVNDTLCNFL